MNTNNGKIVCKSSSFSATLLLILQLLLYTAMLHKRLQTLRKQKGLTQREMADKLHKSTSAYSRMESGEIRIAVEELIAGHSGNTGLYS